MIEEKKFCLRTFGCQMNEHDSQKIGALLSQMGFREVLDPLDAELILFNTCTIREKAHQKAFSEIGKAIAAKKQRSFRMGVCGCVAQEEGIKLLHRFPEIDLIFGPDQIYKLPDLLQMVEESGKPAIATELINDPKEYHFLDSDGATRLRGPCAYVTIMKGCNSHCSYCIVPKVRGSEVYRPARDVIREIGFLVKKGCQEVTLLGQNVNSYGHKNEGGSQTKDKVGFAGLIRLISENTDVARIRFTSPHPKDVDEALVEEYRTNSKLCAHIHLPLQSGADSVLKRMRRAYNTKTFQTKVERLREANPRIGITTDLIVGFPQESDEEFEATLRFVQEIGFDDCFAFKYSPRPQTEAASLKDDVPIVTKETRLQRLLALQNEISFKKNQMYVGCEEEILVEERGKKGENQWVGRTSSNKAVNFTSNKELLGAIVKVEIEEALSHSLKGRLSNGRNKENNI